MRLEDMEKLHQALNLLREVRNDVFNAVFFPRKVKVKRENIDQVEQITKLVEQVAERVNEDLCRFLNPTKRDG